MGIPNKVHTLRIVYQQLNQSYENISNSGSILIMSGKWLKHLLLDVQHQCFAIQKKAYNSSASQPAHVGVSQADSEDEVISGWLKRSAGQLKKKKIGWGSVMSLDRLSVVNSFLFGCFKGGTSRSWELTELSNHDWVDLCKKWLAIIYHFLWYLMISMMYHIVAFISVYLLLCSHFQLWVGVTDYITAPFTILWHFLGENQWKELIKKHKHVVE